MTPMRRKDRAIDREEALDIADRCEYATVSMIDPTGDPYCAAVSIALDRGGANEGANAGEKLYFHAAMEGFKTDCLTANPKVCVLCVGNTERLTNEFSTKYESAVIRGSAHPVTNDEEKIHALRLICERHTPAFMHAFDDAVAKMLHRTAVWAIEVESITGKAKR